MNNTNNAQHADDYDAIAPFYDIEHEQFDEDLDLYQNYAELAGPGSPLLELACGSGRLLIPLASEGYTLVGVDSSTAMLDLAGQHAREAGVEQRITLLQQDMRSLHLSQRFHLAFCALGSFAHLTTRQAQRQALASARAHMAPRGTFILDISNEDARYMERLSGQVLHQGTWRRENGSLLTHFVSPASSSGSHLLELTHFYDEHLQGGPLRRAIITTYLYLFERSEMELLLEEAGFTVKEVFGDYSMGPFTLDSPRMIFIAEARM
ncbi:MAG TPA: class I SAM-dependent methyltransferase [Ktedonobacteraceae bacterium]|nr:class I SAM-dependent methyltransferase [Ktedonobacteraceae bacterium]